MEVYEHLISGVWSIPPSYTKHPHPRMYHHRQLRLHLQPAPQHHLYCGLLSTLPTQITCPHSTWMARTFKYWICEVLGSQSWNLRHIVPRLTRWDGAQVIIRFWLLQVRCLP